MIQNIRDLNARESIHIFRALGSETRVRLLELLSEREMNIIELSAALSLTQPSVTKHVQLLEEAGLVASEYIAAPQGMQKKCRRVYERIVVDLAPAVPDHGCVAEIELPVGMYSSVEAIPTCGLATRDKFIGLIDSPLSFYLPERSQAEILWSAGGWIEYAFPNTIPLNACIQSIELVAEVGSEAPGYNNHYPSDLTLWINDVEIGTWCSPGDYGGVRGQLNPSWYPDNMNQSGLLKIWQLDPAGASIDGINISDVSVDELNIRPWQVTKVKLGIKPDSINQGGFTLYGRGFGNYQLGMILRIKYDQPEALEVVGRRQQPAVREVARPLRKRLSGSLN
ncbi:MAG: ArsR/SmtB family transcription factor [Fimbriimonas sp.]